MTFRAEHEGLLIECENRMVQLVKQGSPPAWKRWEVEDYQNQRNHGPRYGCGAWFGRMPAYRQMRYRRAINDLAEDGLLTVWNEFSKLSHVQLTRKGRRRPRI